MSDRGVFALLGALVGGVVLGERAGPSPATGALLTALALLLLALALRGRRGSAVVALVAIALLGGALMQRALDGLEHWPLAAAVISRADVTVTGSLVDDPEGTRYSTRTMLRIRVAVAHRQQVDAGRRTVLVHADGETAQRLRLLAAGDEVTLAGWLRPLDGYDERFRWRHVVARLDVVELRGFTRPRSPLMRAANRLRALVLDGTRSLPTTERGLVAAFLVGDTRDLPVDVIERFRAAGMSHLLVVSGENVAFVLALVSPALGRLPRRARFLAGLSILVLFGAMTRWEPSVLRACVMAACAMTGIVLGRPVAGRRVLALAVGTLLAADPFLLHSVGFLLSCGACAGIVFAAPWIIERCPGPAWARTVLGTTAAAQLGVAPALLAVFGSVPLVSLPANLVAIPLAAPLTTWGLATGVVGGLVPATAAVLQVPTRLLAGAVVGIADLAARAPVDVDARNAIVVAGALAAALVGTRMLRRHAPADDAVVLPPR